MRARPDAGQFDNTQPAQRSRHDLPPFIRSDPAVRIFAAAAARPCIPVTYGLSAMPDSGIASLAPVAGLDVTLADGVLSVTINRPDSLNSLITPVITGIADAMEQAAADPGVKVVRLGGAGRGFSSGPASAPTTCRAAAASRPTKSSWRSTA